MTKDKELVCVAPDGSLEIWSRLNLPERGWEICRSGFSNTVGVDLFAFDWGEQPPEFWGREMLGEL